MDGCPAVLKKKKKKMILIQIMNYYRHPINQTSKTVSLALLQTQLPSLFQMNGFLEVLRRPSEGHKGTCFRSARANKILRKIFWLKCEHNLPRSNVLITRDTYLHAPRDCGFDNETLGRDIKCLGHRFAVPESQFSSPNC